MIIIQIHSSWKRKSRDFITKLVYNVTRELDNFSKFMHNLSALGLVLITAEWNDGESRTPSTIWRRARLKSLPLSRGSMVLVFFRDIFLSTKDSMVARLLRLFKVCAVIMMIKITLFEKNGWREFRAKFQTNNTKAKKKTWCLIFLPSDKVRRVA